MKTKFSLLVAAVLLVTNAMADQTPQLWPDNVASKPTKDIAPVSSLVDGLAKRLYENPDDAGGWLLLAKSYRHLDRPAEANTAYANAKQLGQSDADLEAWLAGNSSEETDIEVVRDWLNQ